MLSNRLKLQSYSLQILLILILCILVFLIQEYSAQADDNVSYHKIIAPKNSLQADGGQIVLWHDYDSFALYRISHDAWQEIPKQIRSNVTLADDMDHLLLSFKDLNVDHGANDAFKSYSYSGKALHLIQFVGPIKDEWLDRVRDTGTEPVHYIANNGYLVWAGESERQQLQKLAAQGDFLQKSLPYLPSFKFDPNLVHPDGASTENNELVTVMVQMYRHVDAKESENIISNFFIDTLSRWEPILKYQNITGTVLREDIPTITQLPDVVWVGEQKPRELMDEVQGQILAGSLNADHIIPDGPGYLDWLTHLEFSKNPNDYPIVDITDDGIGNGQAIVAAGDITLHDQGNANNPSRVEYIANCTSAPSGSSPEGHGHINISIAGGFDNRPGAPYLDDLGFQRGLGINPYGRFAGTRVFKPNFDLSGCGGSEINLIRQTYNNGARIVSNSWGCGSCANNYDGTAQIYDTGVRDADHITPGNQELFILFSAGNDGPEEATVSSPGNGKNIVTVGASENVRPTWNDGCNIGPEEADNAQDIARFSSRGPAPGGRVKPDIVAPGTHVQGTASTDPTYNGQEVCDIFQPDNQIHFASSSGTSHSTPAVAGMASLAHAYIRQKVGIENPSPALLRGFIIAHTSYLVGEGAGGDLPSHNQGYGLPNMTAAFDDTSRFLIDQEQIPLFTTTGQTWSKTLSVADPNKPVRIVMAYTDQPGAIGTQPQVNDLNLSVKSHNEIYVGNHMSGQWSTPGGTADKVNNVEAIYLPAGSDSLLEITVTAFNIAGDGVPNVGDETDQDFTLVCSNCIDQDFSLEADPQTNHICLPGNAEYDILLGSANFSEPVTLHLSDLPPGVSSYFNANPIIPPNQSLLTLTAEPNTNPGSYPITVTGSSETRQHELELNLDIFSHSPQPPQLLSPPNGANDQKLDILLTWAPADQTASYEIEIATDPDFHQIVEQVSSITSNSFNPSNLKASHIYYWRVRAVNGCGLGAFSETYTFSTETLPGACPIGIMPKILYQTDFEENATGWNSGGIGDTWTLSSARFHSGSTSYFAQNVDSISDQYLISPPINLPELEGTLTLQFWNYQEIERKNEDVCYDGALIEISTDDGSTWQQMGGPPNNNNVLLTDPYDGYVDISFENPLGGLASWCGDPQAWINSVVNLENYAEKTVRFRFRLGTDNNMGREGWYIDDFLVQSCPVTVKKAFLPIAINLPKQVISSGWKIRED